MIPQSIRAPRAGLLRSLAAAFLTLALLSGCGGGGGRASNSDTGGSTGSSNDGTARLSVTVRTSGAQNNTDVALSVSPLNIYVSAVTRDSAPQAANIFASLNGIQGQTYYLEGHYSTNGIASIDGGLIENATPVFDVHFKDPAALGPGVYTDSIQIKGCTDKACSQQAGDSPQTVQVTYTVEASTVQLTSISPPAAVFGAQDFAATLTGADFTDQSEVFWNGNALTAVFISSTQLKVEVPSGTNTAAGSLPVYVADPTNGRSNTLYFTVTNSSMQLSSLSPNSVVASGPLFLLSVTGSQFTPQSVVLWNGMERPTAVVSSTQLVARITAADIATSMNVPVAVNDPVNGTSTALNFKVSPATLTLESLSPVSVTAGGPAFSLTVLGAGFTNLSVVKWNGAPLPTIHTYANGTNELIAQVSAADIAALGIAQVTVQDSTGSGATTAPLTLNIVAPSKDAVTYQLNVAHTGAVSFASVSLPTTPAWTTDVGGTPAYSLIANGKVYVTVGLSGRTSNVLALDGSTGRTVWGPVSISGVTNAAYDGGKIFLAIYPAIGPPVMEALDAQTGLLLWRTPLSGAQGVPSAPTAANGLIYLGNAAIDEATGLILWQAGVITLGTDALTADGAYIAVACYTEDQRPATGEVIWGEMCDPHAASGGEEGVAVAANQSVYAQDSYPLLTSGAVYKSETGSSQGTYVSDVPQAFSTTAGYYLQGGTFQDGTISGATLSAVQLSDSTTLWTFTGDGELVTSPVVINQYVFIGSNAGNLYALDASTGQQVWHTLLTGTISQGARWGTGAVLSGLSAGEGLLVVPNGTKVTTFVVSTNP